jgi:hypothetical protein
VRREAGGRRWQGRVCYRELERVATAGASKRGRGKPDVVKESEYNKRPALLERRERENNKKRETRRNSGRGGKTSECCKVNTRLLLVRSRSEIACRVEDRCFVVAQRTNERLCSTRQGTLEKRPTRPRVSPTCPPVSALCLS